MNSYNGFSPAQRSAAQRWLVQQWDSGKVARPTKCCACGQDHGVIDAHAEDYNRPFGPHIYQYPLCYRCHMTLHCRFYNPQAWQRYLRLLREGWSWAPIATRSFGPIANFLAGREHPSTRGPARTVLIFDTMFDHNIRPKAVELPPQLPFPT